MSDQDTGLDLSGIRLLAGMGSASLDRLAAAAHRRHLPSGQNLYEQGETARDLYIVTRGRLALRVSDGQRWTTVQGVEAEDLLGWSALRENPRWLTTARALGPVEVIVIPLASVLDAIEAGGPDARLLVQRLFGAGAAHLDAVRQQLQQPGSDAIITGG